MPGSATVSPNPDLVLRCGLNIVVVLDESGSIRTSDQCGSDPSGCTQTVRNAFMGIINAFTDTGTRFGLIKFSTTSDKKEFSTNPDVFYLPATTANLPVFQAYADAYSPGGWTNWEDAFKDVIDINNSTTTPGVDHADLVIFLTDGNPTASGDGSNASGDETKQDGFTLDAVDDANTVKEQGSHILMVGIGDGLMDAASQNRLQQVSGPDIELNGATASTDFTTADVIMVADPTDLETTMRALAVRACGYTLNLFKYIGDMPLQPSDPTFTFRVEVVAPQGWHVRWNQPEGLADDSVATVSADPSNQGAARFVWELFGGSGGDPPDVQVTVAELSVEGFQVFSVECALTDLVDGYVTHTSAPLTPLYGGEGGGGGGAQFDLTVGNSTKAHCTVYNRDLTVPPMPMICPGGAVDAVPGGPCELPASDHAYLVARAGLGSVKKYAYSLFLLDGSVVEGVSEEKEALIPEIHPDFPVFVDCSDGFGLSTDPDNGDPRPNGDAPGYGEKEAPLFMTSCPIVHYALTVFGEDDSVTGSCCHRSDSAEISKVRALYNKGRCHEALRGDSTDRVFFTFVLSDGTRVSGSSASNEATIPEISETTPVHLSCSDGFGFGDGDPGNDGFGEKGAPVQGVDPYPIVAYLITRFKSSGEFQKLCCEGDVSGGNSICGRVVELAQPPSYDNNDDAAAAVAYAPGIPGVVVELFFKGEDELLATATTDADGFYQFDNLECCNYSVVQTDREGYFSTGSADTVGGGGDDPNRVSCLDLCCGEKREGVDFFDARLASVSGTVYNDSDRSGNLSPGDVGIPGVTVQLLEGAGPSVVATALTDAYGFYEFPDLLPGAYTVVEVNPEGFVSTGDAAPPNDDSIPVSLASGEAASQRDFFDAPATATVTGLVFQDTDGDAVHDEPGEPGIPYVTVLVTDSEGQTHTATTDGSGRWSVQVAPGTALVNVDQTTVPPGFVDTTANEPRYVQVPAGATVDSGKDGYQPRGALFGVVFQDTNGNGNQDAGEPGIPYVDVVITDSLGNAHTVTTDAQGGWSLDVPAGSTSVDVYEPSLPPGLVQTAGTDPEVFEVAAGANLDAGADGYQPRGVIFGRVFQDTDGNTLQDAGELGIPYVDVVITDSLGGVQTVTTDSDGNWSADVPAGTALVDVDQATVPAGFVDTTGNEPRSVNVPTGSTTDSGKDGYQPRGALFGVVFEDTDGNGTQDAGEPGIPYVDVVITDSLGNAHTVTTDSQGGWSLSVPAGSTTVDVYEPSLPPGLVQTAGTDPEVFEVAAGANLDAGVDGYQPSGALFGVVFEDTNGNGSQDAGEPGLAYVEVVITDSLGNVHTVTTDAQGGWNLDVPAGSTTVDVYEPSLPPGLVQTAGTDPEVFQVAAGANLDAGVDGYQPRGVVFGRVFEDTDGNSTQDAGELGIPYVNVVITDSLGGVQTVTTDSDGYWSAQVPAGTALVDVDQATVPAGFVDTTGNEPRSVSVPAGSTTDSGKDGYQPRGTLTGCVFEDTNGNGAQDAGEPGLAYVDVSVSDSQGNSQTVTTDANGNWSADVAAGSASVDVVQSTVPNGFVDTTQNEPRVVDVPAGSVTDSGKDGYQPRGGVSGVVFQDTDGDGVQGGGEPGIPYVSVVVTDSLGQTQTVVTDALGRWFAEVAAGTTQVDVDQATVPAGFVDTTANEPRYVSVPSGTGVTDSGKDGYQPRGALFGVVFEDTNGNGSQDAGEPGIPYVDVVITDSLGNAHTVTTDAQGGWSLDVPAGSTGVDVDQTTLPPGLVQTAGTDPEVFDVAAGANLDAGADGYQPRGTVFGRVFLDKNGDGVLNFGEPGIANVDVELKDSLGGSQTVTTNFIGLWSAGAVPAGLVNVNVDQSTVPANYTDTTGNEPRNVNVPAGSVTDSGADGYRPEGLLQGTVYEDTNGNGTQDAGELGIPGVTVNVTDGEGNAYVVVTDSYGRWEQVVYAGPALVNVDDSTLPPGSVQTEGDDPTVVTVPAGGTASTVDGYQREADLQISKSAVSLSGFTPPRVGDFVRFSLEVRNNGPGSATNVSVVDSLPPGYCYQQYSIAGEGGDDSSAAVLEWTLAELQAGAAVTLEYVAQAKEAVEGASAAEQYTNVAVVRSEQPEDPVPYYNNRAELFFPPMGIRLVKCVEPEDGLPAGSPGDELHYSFKITNVGGVDLVGLLLEDTFLEAYLLAPVAASLPVTLGVGQTHTTAQVTYVTEQTDFDAGFVENFARVEAFPDAEGYDVYGSVSDEDEKKVNLRQQAAITLVKSSTSNYMKAGQTIEYCYAVKNTGTVTLTLEDISDDVVGAIPVYERPVLLPGEEHTFKADYSVTQQDVDAGFVENVATVVGVPPPPLYSVEAEDDLRLERDLVFPCVHLRKTVSSIRYALGDVLTYTYEVMNCGHLTLNNLRIVDSVNGGPEEDLTYEYLQQGGPDPLPPGLFPYPSFTVTREITQADVDAGRLHNYATVTAFGPGPSGYPVSSSDCATSTTNTEAKIVVEKSAQNLSTYADPEAMPYVFHVSRGEDCELEEAVGDCILYTYTVTNTGYVTLENLRLEDVVNGDPASLVVVDTGYVSTLLPGDSHTFSLKKVMTQADANAGTLTNVVEATATDPSGYPVSDVAMATVMHDTMIRLCVTKENTDDCHESPTPCYDLGEVGNFKITVTNKSNVDLEDVSVFSVLKNDAYQGSETETELLTIASLPRCGDGVSVCDSTPPFSQEDVNNGCVRCCGAASVTFDGELRRFESDPVTFCARRAPSMTVEKTVSPAPPELFELGQTLTYSLRVVNTGNVSLTNVTLSDPALGLSMEGVENLEPGDYSEALVVTRYADQEDVDAACVVNTVTAEARAVSTDFACAGCSQSCWEEQVAAEGGGTVSNTLAVSAQATAKAVQNPAIEVRKTVDAYQPPVLDTVGQLIEYVLEIENVGNLTLSDILLVDLLLDASGQNLLSPAESQSLAVGQVLEKRVSYAVKQEDLDRGAVSNTATVEGTAPDGYTVVADYDTEEFPLDRNPAIELDKRIAGTSLYQCAGNKIAYEFEISNAGNVTLCDTQLFDTVLGAGDLLKGNSEQGFQTPVQILDAEATGNQIIFASRIAVDCEGNVFVSSVLSNVFRLSAYDGSVTEILDSTGDGVNSFQNSLYIATNQATGDVFVGSLFNNRVFQITPAGNVSSIIDGTGDGSNSLLSPAGIAVNGQTGDVFVAGSISNNVFKITQAGYVTEIINSSGDDYGNVCDYPEHLSVDESTGDVFVACAGSDNVFKVSSSGTVSQILDQNGAGIGNGISGISGVAVHELTGNVFVSDSITDKVFKVTPGGSITVIATAGDGLDSPTSIAVDVAGNVFVTSPIASTVHVIDGDSGNISVIMDSSGDGAGNGASFIPSIAINEKDGTVYAVARDSRNAFKVVPKGSIPAKLAPGASFVYQQCYSVTEEDVAAGRIDNVATVTALPSSPSASPEQPRVTAYAEATACGPPLVSCPADTSTGCLDSIDPQDLPGGAATAESACGFYIERVFYTDLPEDSEEYPATAGCGSERTISREWRAEDSNGLVSKPCTQTVSVVDDLPPLIVCPPEATVSLDERCEPGVAEPLPHPSETGFATASEGCSGEPITPTWSDGPLCIIPGQCRWNTKFTRTWTALSSCGQAASCEQTILLVDDTPPALVCPPDAVVECTESTEPERTGRATATDNCPCKDSKVPEGDITYYDTVVVHENENNSHCNEGEGEQQQQYPGVCALRTITRTWRCVDLCGNASECEQIITVTNTVPPVITCPPNDHVLIECGDPLAEITPEMGGGSATAVDACGNEITPTYHDAEYPGPCAQSKTVVRTWTAVDACGNVATCEQTIAVGDFRPPEFSFCPPEVDVECGESLDPANTGGTATATDNCSRTEYVDVSWTDREEEEEQGYEGCLGERRIVRTWTATDECGLQTSCEQVINVVRRALPEIECPYAAGEIVVECPGGTSPEELNSFPVATGTSCQQGEEGTLELSFYDSVEPDPAGCEHVRTITRTWTATDDCGNASAPCEQVIRVVDTTAPTVGEWPPDACVIEGGDTSPAGTGYPLYVLDACDPDPEVTFSDALAPCVCPPSTTITRTWTVRDCSGNSVQHEQVILVKPEAFCCVVVGLTVEPACAVLGGGGGGGGTPASSECCARLGDTLTFRYKVRNCGNRAFQITLLKGETELQPGTPPEVREIDTYGLSDVLPGHSVEFSSLYQVGLRDVALGCVAHTAAVFVTCDDSADGCGSQQVMHEDNFDQLTVVVCQEPGIELTKSVAPQVFTEDTDSLSYTFVITNTGDTPLHDLQLQDDDPELAFYGTDLAQLNGLVLLPGEIVTILATRSTALADPEQVCISNLATVQARYAIKTFDGSAATEGSVSDQASAEARLARLVVEKEVEQTQTPTGGAEGTSNSKYSTVGEQVTFRVTVRNTGKVALKDVSLSECLSRIHDC